LGGFGLVCWFRGEGESCDEGEYESGKPELAHGRLDLLDSPRSLSIGTNHRTSGRGRCQGTGRVRNLNRLSSDSSRIRGIIRIGGSMKGNPAVIEHLNHALRDELTAINQYFLHAEMSENWGYKKYSKYIKKQSIDEMKHAEFLMERILFLDGLPKMEPFGLAIGQSVREMIESDLKLEHEAVASYNESIRICVENGDNGSRDLFMKLLKDEEGHVDWLEAQVHQIKEIGYERYLITQTEE
jgi:bacterioferritin